MYKPHFWDLDGAGADAILMGSVPCIFGGAPPKVDGAATVFCAMYFHGRVYIYTYMLTCFILLFGILSGIYSDILSEG